MSHFTIHEGWEHLVSEGSQHIQNFLKRLQGDDQGAITQSIFVTAKSFEQAQLMICFCFGQLQTPDLIEAQYKANDDDFKFYLKKVQDSLGDSRAYNPFCWDDRLRSNEIFRKNISVLRDKYTIFRKVIEKVKPSASKIFKNICENSKHLYSTKIRINKFGKKDFSYKRENEKFDSKFYYGNRYLVIFEPTENQILIGMIVTENQLSESELEINSARKSSKTKIKHQDIQTTVAGYNEQSVNRQSFNPNDEVYPYVPLQQEKQSNIISRPKLEKEGSRAPRGSEMQVMRDSGRSRSSQHHNLTTDHYRPTDPPSHLNKIPKQVEVDNKYHRFQNSNKNQQQKINQIENTEPPTCPCCCLF